jgi:voltage-gated potassium channel
MCYLSPVSAVSYVPKLVFPEANPARRLLARVFWIFGILALACFLLWLQRHGLADDRGGELSLLDVMYFTIVTVTTVGYGDIVPVTDEARAMITFGINPLRIAIWLILLSTAYELVIRRSVESYALQRIKRVMKQHTIICGFGVKGRAAAKELIERGVSPSKIIVIDSDASALESAALLGVVGLRGDASRESTLRAAAIESVADIVVVPNTDQACVLICLTARDLAPNAHIVAAAREDENVKLIYRSGADTVLAPAASGGRLLAAVTQSPSAAMILSELFEHGKGADIYDYVVTPGDVGKLPDQVKALAEKLVLAIVTGGRRLSSIEARAHKLRRGDVVIVYEPAARERALGSESESPGPPPAQ